MGRRKWGKWELTADAPISLVYRAGTGEELYDITMIVCQTAKRQAAWVRQMAEKSWVTAQDIVHLLCAFRDLAKAGLIKESLVGEDL